MALEPFWNDGPSKVHVVDGVRFQSTLINPIAECQHPEKYPLVIWFCGLGPSGLDGIGVELASLSDATSKPFVLVAPIRSWKTWWVLDDGQPPFGCLTGSLLRNEVVNFCRWIQSLAGASGIDHTSVSLFGGSAGAYATSEILALGTCQLHCVGLAALHGHGRPDVFGLDEKEMKRSSDIIANWRAYIKRIKEHPLSPKKLIGVHTEEDSFCPWKYAGLVYQALDDGREMQGLPPTTLVRVQPSAIRPFYHYGPEAFKLFLEFAIGDAGRFDTMLAAHSSFSQPTMVSGGPAFSCPRDAGVGSSSSQDLYSGRVRSRSPREALSVEHVVTVPRGPVVQDGILPAEHIGSMLLAGGVQVLYIAHSDDKDAAELWTRALEMVNNSRMPDLKYFDSFDDKGQVMCKSVCAALSTTRGQFADSFFQCAEVGDLIAVGFGSNNKKRKRSGRIAAAVCFQLQTIAPVVDFSRYPDLERLITQVRSDYPFLVRAG